jgi:O-antigen/teichoic acid export membrane protein
MRLSQVAWNAAGLAVPLLVALWCVPQLLRLLGVERFGLLALAWALTAVSGLFDLGIGRATTQRVSALLGADRVGEATAVATWARRVALLAGTAGTLLLLVATTLGAYRAIGFAPDLEPEVRAATLLLALVVPLQTLIATDRGIAEACQRFRGISLARMALGVANFAAPLAVAAHTTHMAWLVGTLVVARLVAMLAYRQLARRALPATGHAASPSPAEKRALLRAGGWFSVSAAVGPLLVHADRFVIGALMSAAAVTSYAVPFDVVTQLLIVVTAVSTVAFPAIARELQVDAAAARARFRRWLSGSALAMSAVCAFAAWLLPAAFDLWLGAALPAEAVAVGRWLCLGVAFNAVGAMYLAWLHARGRFRATALLHLIELPLYLGLLWALVTAHGVVGAAMAWVVRVAFDTAGLATLTRRTQ